MSDLLKNLGQSDFDEFIKNTDKPVLVDFWAEWCGPCRIVGPIVEKLAEEYSGKVRVGKLNVDQNVALASKYGVTGIPTLLVFKSGEVADSVVGAAPEKQLKKMLDKHVDSKTN